MKTFKQFLGASTIVAILSIAAYLFVPVPSTSRAQFVQQQTWAGTSSGTANAQTLVVANYSANLVGVPISFIVGFTNTGPTTININGIGAANVFRQSSIGPVALSGSELSVGEMVTVVWTGSYYQITSYTDMTPIGSTVQFRGANTPRGSLIEDGSCVSRTTYAPLFAVIGTTYGACDGSTTFAVPDSRGTAFTALDNQGANGAANRITVGASGCNATAVGTCGQQTNTLLTANLPAYTPTGTVGINDPGHIHGISDPGHTHGVSGGGTAGTSSGNFSSGSFTAPLNATGIIINSATTGITVNGAFTGITASFSGVAQGGSSTAFTNLMPISIGRRAIKY